MKTSFSAEGYSGNWDEKTSRWKANVQRPDGKGWTTKWIPRRIGDVLLTCSHALDAEMFIVAFLKKFRSSWVAPANNEVVQVKTLAHLIPRWIKLRYDSPSTKMNYFKSLKVSGNCWILDNKDHHHLSIQDLNIETELSVSVLRTWISSLKGKPRTRVASIKALGIFFDDAVDEGWLSEDFVNPLEKRPLKKIHRALIQAGNELAEVKTVPVSQINALLSSSIIPLYRKVKYAVAYGTGLRDHELHGLTFADLHLSGECSCFGPDEEISIPHLRVERQLLKRGSLPALSYEIETLQKGTSKDVLFSKKNAIVSKPKRGSRRLLPLHPEVSRALEHWRDHGFMGHVGRKPTKADPVFARQKKSLRQGHNAGDFTMMMSAELLNKDLQLLGFGDGNTCHGLRRTFANELDRLGVAGGSIDRLLGHAKKTTADKNYIKGDLLPLHAAVSQLTINPVSLSRHKLNPTSSKGVVKTDYDVSAESLESSVKKAHRSHDEVG